MDNKTFSDRVRDLRTDRSLTQKELAKLSGISLRSIQNYETAQRAPANISVVQQLAKALGTTSAELLGEDGRLVLEASERGGRSAARDVKELVTEVSGLFAGGEIDDSEKDAVMAALSAAYWDAKEKNKKYASKRR
jgi:transcriptional regulator with XRE-family HTH domain